MSDDQIRTIAHQDKRLCTEINHDSPIVAISGGKTVDNFEPLDCGVGDQMSDDDLAQDLSINTGVVPPPQLPSCVAIHMDVADSKVSSDPKARTKHIDLLCKTSRVQLSDKDILSQLSKDQLLEKWTQQNMYIDLIEEQVNQKDTPISKIINTTSLLSTSSTNNSLRVLEEKLRQQQLTATRRENVLIVKLTMKEQEVQHYLVGTWLDLTCDTPIMFFML